MSVTDPRPAGAAATLPPEASLARLAEASTALARCRTLGEVTAQLGRAGRDLLGAAAIALELDGRAAPGAPWPLALLAAPAQRARVLTARLPLVFTDLTADPQLPASERERAAAEGLAACLVLPLVGLDPPGVWAIFRRAAGEWSASDEALAAVLAAQAGSVLAAIAPELRGPVAREAAERERADSERADSERDASEPGGARRRREQIDSIQTSVAALSGELAVEQLLDRVVSEAARAFDVPAVGLYLWDQTRAQLAIRASCGLSPDYVREQRLPRQRVLATADADGVIPAMILPDLRREPFGRLDLILAEDLVSAMAAPMLAGANLLGALIVYSRGAPRAFTPDELELCTLFSRYAAVALQNAELYEKARQRADELALLHQVSVATSSALNVDELLDEIARQVGRLLKTDSLYIALYDEAEDELDFRVLLDQGERLPSVRHAVAEESVAGWIVRQRQALLIGDWERDSPHSPVAGLIVGRGDLPRCYMGQPLLARERLVGVISAQSDQPGAFTPEHHYLLAAIANQAAVAIQNAQLFEETRRRVLELSALQLTTLQLTATLDLSAVLESIATATLKLVTATNLHIFLYNDERDEFVFGAALDQSGSRAAQVDRPRKHGLTATVVRERRPLVINDARRHPLYAGLTAPAFGIEAIAGFPLMRAGRVLGVLSVAYLTPHRFTPDELRILALLADHAAIAVENARLYQDVQRRLVEVSTLYSLARQTTSSLELDTVLDAVVGTLKQVLDCRACAILLVNDDTRLLEIRAAVGISERWRHDARLQLGEGVAGRVVREGRQIYVSDSRREPEFVYFDPAVRSLLCVPLTVKGRVIGALSIDSERPDAFSGIDERMLTIAAAQAAVAIENAQLYRDLKERAEKLERAYAELKEVDRLKDELVQNISHELRTPLTFIKGYVEVISAGELGPLNERQRDSLLIVAGKTDAVTRLVNDILSLQQLEGGALRLEPVDLAALVHQAVLGASVAASGQGVTLVEDVPPGLPPVLADRDRIHEVLDNLLSNAIKFSPDGGRVTVRIREQSGEAGPELVVSVEDTGIGIPQDQLVKIWQRFYQVDGSATRRFGGTGLGLAIVQRIIQAHAGRVWASSGVGRGSVFSFSLPCAEGWQP